MIEGIGSNPGFGPLKPLGPRPLPVPPPPKAAIPTAPARVGDSATFTSRHARVPAAGPSDADWRALALATRQAGLGGLFDRLSDDVASQHPAQADGLPLEYEAGPGARASGRAVLGVAQSAKSWTGRGSSLAALAAELALPEDRAMMVASAVFADRQGSRSEASHALFRLAQRATTATDALAAGRRAVTMGYPENAKIAYHKAATLSPDAASALAVAQEATAQGLGFEVTEPALARWRQGMDRMFQALEGPTAGPTFASASPYAAGAMARDVFVNPYVAALRKAKPSDMGAVARAATRAGETATAALAWRRVRETNLQSLAT